MINSQPYLIIDRKEHQIPSDFDYSTYLKLNPDLQQKGISTEDLAKKHYLLFGIHENRTYKKQSIIHGNIDLDFDAAFYISEYPDVAEYYKHTQNISQYEKLFHHYIHFGKKEGRFKNKIEQDKSLINIDESILELIQSNDLICPQNNLECVCLLTTEKEFKNGKFKKFILHLINQTKSTDISKNIDFKIIFNRKNKNQSIVLTKLKNIFKNIDIISLDLSKKEDIYTNKIQTIEKLPKYGLKSGPNHMFFHAMNQHHQYNTTLLLETDCILGENWLNNLYYYTKYANGFLVSGAIYDGTVFTKAGSAMMNHINGGTALYATNNTILQKTIKILSKFLEQQIIHSMPGLAYDYALKLLIDQKINNSYNNQPEREVWQFINRNYLPCKLIINCSTDNNSQTNINNLIKKYNYSILHIKE